MSYFHSHSDKLPAPEETLPGRKEAVPVATAHYVTGNPLQPPFPEEMQQAIFGMGCFWGGEKMFWQHEGVFSTAVGYSGGHTANPTYREICSGQTGHNEVILVIYDPTIIDYSSLLTFFWEGHDPTQGMRQGNDRGTQYRSMIQCGHARHEQQALESKKRYQTQLKEHGFSTITTEIIPARPFYYAEDEHQQYLAKNPQGYCGLGGTGIALTTEQNNHDQ